MPWMRRSGRGGGLELWCAYEHTRRKDAAPKLGSLLATVSPRVDGGDRTH